MDQPRRIMTLQLFRGVAALLVVLYHASVYSQEQLGHTFLAGLFLFGHTGVDFFFVLSGFIIYYIHFGDIGHNTRLWNFAIKRLTRVLPIYWIVTGIKLVLIFSAPAIAQGYERDLKVIINSLLLIPQRNGPIINVAWTLSYEMLFYILFGLAIVLGKTWATRLFLAWVAAIIIYTGGKILGMSWPDVFLLRFLLNERNLEFCLGCLSAKLVMTRKVPAPLYLVFLGILMFGAAAVTIARGYIPALYAPIFGVASFLVVTGTAAYELYHSSGVLRPFVFLGDASYSIYLTHVMFISAVAVVYNRFNVSTVLGAFFTTQSIILIAVAAGCFFYLILERPLLRWLSTYMAAKFNPQLAHSDMTFSANNEDVVGSAIRK